MPVPRQLRQGPQTRARTRSRQARRGQSVVEFALVVPILLVMVVAIADFGRLYTSAVAVESAAREAADFGALRSDRWSAPNVDVTVDGMLRRACVAAAGSHLEGYTEPEGTVDHADCSNPAFTCRLEWGGASTDCRSSGGRVGTTDCAVQVTEPPCSVHVRLDYDFQTFLSFPGMPVSVALVRESRFRMQDLTP